MGAFGIVESPSIDINNFIYDTIENNSIAFVGWGTHISYDKKYVEKKNVHSKYKLWLPRRLAILKL